MGTGNFKTLSHPTVSSDLTQTFFIRTLATIMVQYSPFVSLALCQVLKILWNFEILTGESMGKS